MTIVTTDRPTLPGSAWAVALLSAAGEVGMVAWRGSAAIDGRVVVSMLLSGLVVVWVSYGVLKGGIVRTVLAITLTALSLLAIGWEMLEVGAPLPAWLTLVAAVGTLLALVALVRSPYYAWQRRHHDTRGVAIGGVLVLAALTGVAGPLSTDDLAQVEVRF